jgi:hypothetical protein
MASHNPLRTVPGLYKTPKNVHTSASNTLPISGADADGGIVDK